MLLSTAAFIFSHVIGFTFLLFVIYLFMSSSLHFYCAAGTQCVKMQFCFHPALKSVLSGANRPEVHRERTGDHIAESCTWPHSVSSILNSSPSWDALRDRPLSRPLLSEQQYVCICTTQPHIKVQSSLLYIWIIECCFSVHCTFQMSFESL